MTTSPWRLGARTLALCTAALLFPATVYAAQTASGSPGLSVWPPSPAVVAVAWPIVTGLASLLYTRLDATSRAHAIFAMLASVGLDLPTLGAMISKAVVGRFTLGMKARAAKIAGSALAMMLLPGCGWWNSGGSSTVASGGEQLGICVAEQVFAGNVDPASVAAACGGVAVADVASIIESLWAYYSAGLQDAGMSASLKVCGSGKAPAGAPPCITLGAYDALKQAVGK